MSKFLRRKYPCCGRSAKFTVVPPEGVTRRCSTCKRSWVVKARPTEVVVGGFVLEWEAK